MSEDAVTEAEARRLLGAAAATIEVTKPAPLTLTGLPEPRPHRRWSLLLAVAACVALVTGTAWVVARQLGDGEQVPPAPVERPSGAHAYGPGKVPPVVGATVAEARGALTAAGYRVVVEELPSCADPAGHVRLTVPAAGVALPAAGRVRILVSADAGADCVERPASGAVWALVRQARGFAGPAVCGNGDCAAVLATLAELSTRPERLEVAEYDEADLRCLEGGPALPAGQRRFSVHVAWQAARSTGVCPRPPLVQVDVAGDRIAAVRVRGPLPASAESTTVAEPSAARSAAARQFVRWARTGEAPPPFATRVHNRTPGFVTEWNDQPADRTTWSGCSGLGFPGCLLDPVAAAYHSRGAVEVATGTPPCGGSAADSLDASAGDVVRVSAPGFACDGWAVLLWMHDDGVIYAVTVMPLRP